MNRKTTISIFLFIIICVVIFTHFLDLMQYSILSPDSIRFMSFWQKNTDIYENNIFKIIYHSLKDSTTYDLNRGRYIQYIFYGFEVLIHKHTKSNINYIMFIIMVLNNILISLYLVKILKPEKNYLINILLLFLILCSTHYFFSSIVVLVLYGKYLWVTFIIIFFLLDNIPLKIIFLILSSYSDELGLIASLFISILFLFKNARYILFFNLKYKRIIFLSILICFPIFLILVYYGFSAVIFNVGSGLASLSITFGHESIQFPFWSKIYAITYNICSILLGSSHLLKVNYIKISLIISINLFIISILINFLIKFNLKLVNEKLSTFISKNYNFIFWVLMFLAVNYFILPGGINDIGHRGYPRFVTISICLIFVIYRYTKKNYEISLLILLSLHILFFTLNSSSKEEYKKTIANLLFIDSSVNWVDMNKINKSVLEFKNTGKSNTFLQLNSNDEIDFSGTWYYSRLQNYDTSKKKYFPIKGIIRVLIWPKKI